MKSLAVSYRQLYDKVNHAAVGAWLNAAFKCCN